MIATRLHETDGLPLSAHPTKALVEELRLRGWAVVKVNKPRVLSPDLIIYHDRNVVSWRGQTYKTSKRMIEVLRFLAAIHPRRATYGEIAAHVWGVDDEATTANARVYLRLIRHKIPDLIWSEGLSGGLRAHMGLNIVENWRSPDEDQLRDVSSQPAVVVGTTWRPSDEHTDREGMNVQS